MAYEIKRFPYDGTVDADGHILEPADLWENYLEDKYRERALRIRVDDDGYEYLEIDQTPSKRSRNRNARRCWLRNEGWARRASRWST